MTVAQIHARSALNRVVSELYRGRMLAVQNGGPVRLVFQSDSRGCIAAVRVALEARAPDFERSTVLPLVTNGACLRHSGDSAVVFNSRGMLRPPTRSFFVSYGSATDSVLISIAGRIRRSYRRARTLVFVRIRGGPGSRSGSAGRRTCLEGG